MIMINADEYFGHLVPICHLSDKNKKIISDNATLIELKKGQSLFKQGDTDNNSYYLLKGSVELKGLSNNFSVYAHTDNANYALAQFQPRQYSASALEHSTFLSIDKKILDMLAEEDGQYKLEKSEGVVVNQMDDEETGDWMTKILQSDLFNRLSASNIQKIFARIEPIIVEKGEVIINQDDAGDYFYIIEIGRAEVLRKPSEHAHPVKLNDLGFGDYFGEEALISNCPRNANVVMLTDGELMRLPKSDFIELIRDPILVQHEPGEIEQLQEEGFVWIDVRFPDECLENNEFEKLNIPLNLVRMQIEQMDRSKKYITCCEDGKKSAVAAFLLAQKGFNSAFIRGGLLNCRSQSNDGLKLGFLTEKSGKKRPEVIEFIPRKNSKKNKDQSFGVEKQNIIPEQQELEGVEDKISSADKSVKEQEIKVKEEDKNWKNLSSETGKANMGNEKDSGAVVNKVLDKEENDVADPDSKLSVEDKEKENKTNESYANDLSNTDAIKKLLDHYRLEQEKVLEDIRSHAEERITQELKRIDKLYTEKEKIITELKKLKEEVSEKLQRQVQAPVLTEEIEAVTGKKEESKQPEKQLQNKQVGESIEDRIKKVREDIKQTNTKEDNNKPAKKEVNKEVKEENKRQLLSKRYKILNDPKFRDHIRQLNIKKDQEFRQEINAYKSELKEEVSDDLLEEDDLAKTIPNFHSSIKDDRPLDAKSDTTIEEDIRSWIEEQEAFENDPKRVEVLEKKKSLMQKMEEQFERNKRLNKIRDRSLVKEIHSALKSKD